MTLLGRQLLTRFLAAFGGFFLVFTMLFLLIELFDLEEARTLDPEMIGHLGLYVLHRIPFLAYASSPLAAFLATIFVVASNAHRSEVIAAQAGGVSIGRYASPMIVGGTVLAALLLLGAEFKIPEWSDRADYLRRVEIQKKTPPKTEFLDLAFASGGRYVLAERFLPSENLLESVTIITPRDEHVESIERHARLVYAQEWPVEGLPDPKWIELTADAGGLKLVSEKPLEAVAVSTLWREVSELRRLFRRHGHDKLGVEMRERIVRINAKIAFPLTVPFFVLLGAALAARIGRRRGLGAAVTAALTGSLGYLFLLQTSLKIGEVAATNLTWIAFAIPWTAPLVIGSLSVYSLKRR